MHSVSISPCLRCGRWILVLTCTDRRGLIGWHVSPRAPRRCGPWRWTAWASGWRQARTTAPSACGRCTPAAAPRCGLGQGERLCFFFYVAKDCGREALRGEACVLVLPAQVVRLGGPVLCVSWCPKPGVHIVGATCGNSAILLDVAAALRGEKQESDGADGAAGSLPFPLASVIASHTRMCRLSSCPAADTRGPPSPAQTPGRSRSTTPPPCGPDAPPATAAPAALPTWRLRRSTRCAC